MSPTVQAPVPPPLDLRVHRRIPGDMRRELRVRRRGRLPAGSQAPSAWNTWASVADPLRMLLRHHRRYGAVFTVRTLHEPIVWALGAEATHQMLVTEADAFAWRTGHFVELWPLLGDGLLNIDGAYHRDMRRLLLPGFHREQVAGLAAMMVAEATRAVDALVPGARIDLYAWARVLALRIARRGLLGLDAGDDRAQPLAHAFGRALAFHGQSFPVQMLRGPGTPYARAQRARRVLDELVLGEIAERRRRGEPGAGALGLLLAATDPTGAPLAAQAVRDQVVTLLFAGHDTTTATLTFMVYELSRTRAARDAVEAELDAVLGGAAPTPEQLDGTALPVLERTLSETLRRFPPAWVGPRRATRDVEIAGTPIPAGAGVHYCSWATHHLAELYEDPLAFVPDRFLPQAVAERPKGAYVPFGGGSRMCLGKRFGEYELRALAAVLLAHHRFEADPGEHLRIVTTPTLGPAGGLHFTVRPR